MVVAAEEQPVVFRVHGHAGSLLAGADGPVIDQLVRFRVNHDHFIFVFKIVENQARLGIGLREFRFAAERNRGHHPGGLGLDHRCRLAAPVERVKFPPPRLVKHGVGIGAGVRLGKQFQSFQVNERRFVFTPASDHAAAQFRCEGDTVNAGSVGDFTHDLVLRQVHHNHFRAMRNVKPPGRRIHRQVIPAAVARQGNLLDEMIPVFRPAQRRQCRKNQNRRKGVFHNCSKGG